MSSWTDIHPVWTAVLASTVVSAAVSSTIQLVAGYFDREQRRKDAQAERDAREELQRLEREARRREALLAHALKLAERKTQTAMLVAERSGRTATLHDEIFNVAGYYAALASLADSGSLPDELATVHKENLEVLKAQRNRRARDGVVSTTVDDPVGAPLPPTNASRSR